MFDRKRNKTIFLILDIGTEAVKVLVVKKEFIKSNKNLFDRKRFRKTILGSSIQYFEKYGIFDSVDIEKDILKKAILKAMDEAYRNFVFFSEKNERERNRSWRGWPIIVNLPPSILKARIFSIKFLRKNLAKISKIEKNNVYEKIFRNAKEKISLEFKEKYGILPIEIEWIEMKVTQIKINGYLVPDIENYNGRDFEFKILAIFALKNYLKRIRDIFKELGLNVLKIVHIAMVLPFILEDGRKDGVFMDIGGDISQIFLVKNGFLESIAEIEFGGRTFSLQLSDDLGIDEETAKNLKEEYSNKFLSSESSRKIKEIFRLSKRNWSFQLKNKFEEININRFFYLNVFVFGGGSFLPEIKEILGKNKISETEELSFNHQVNVSFIKLNDLDSVKSKIKLLENPQYIPALLNVFEI